MEMEVISFVAGLIGGALICTKPFLTEIDRLQRRITELEQIENAVRGK